MVLRLLNLIFYQRQLRSLGVKSFRVGKLGKNKRSIDNELSTIKLSDLRFAYLLPMGGLYRPVRQQFRHPDTSSISESKI
jgi:hypothetical protein